MEPLQDELDPLTSLMFSSPYLNMVTVLTQGDQEKIIDTKNGQLRI